MSKKENKFKIFIAPDFKLTDDQICQIVFRKSKAELVQDIVDNKDGMYDKIVERREESECKKS